MSWNTPERKVENALRIYFATVLGYELNGVQVITRFSNAEKTEPRLEIFCESCEPYPEDVEVQTGDWLISCKLKIVSHYESGIDAVAHDEIAGSLLDTLLIADENGANNAYSEINNTQLEEDVYVMGLWIKERVNNVEEHSLITEQAIELIVMVSRPNNTGE